MLGQGSGYGPGVMGLMGGGVYPGPQQFAAVYGQAAANFTGVIGQSSGFGSGVYGSCTSGTGNGVAGYANGGHGVHGAANAAGATGIVAGVFGDSTHTYGVIGRTTAAGYSGLTAITGTPNVAALAATSTNAGAFAAYFTGTTVVNGTFVAFGGSKSAAVKDATGQHRLVYCVESPESWFEDFGTGTLVAGQADVALDPLFTQIARTDAYHVFLSEYDDHHLLYVTKRTAGGFAVQAKGGTPSGTFSYRVVAKRADIAGERLAKFDLPKIKIPDESKLPKPEPPRKP